MREKYIYNTAQKREPGNNLGNFNINLQSLNSIFFTKKQCFYEGHFLIFTYQHNNNLIKSIITTIIIKNTL